MDFSVARYNIIFRALARRRKSVYLSRLLNILFNEQLL
jgi:hypothetical protein